MRLSERQRRALEAACDAIVPRLEEGEGDQAAFWRRRASDLGVAEEIPAVFDRLTRGERKELRQLLGLLASPLLGLTWRGPLRPLAALTVEQRQRLFLRWSRSRLLPLRKGFQALKKLTCFLFYGLAPEGRANPNWAPLGYPGPLNEEPPAEPPLPVWAPEREQEISCDLVVVGSGAGGGLAAGLAAEAGLEVVVLEKGPYVPEAELTQREVEEVGRLYEAGGALASTDGGVSFFAGSCLGGGTTVNWTGSFRTPEAVLAEWAADHGLPHLTGDAYQRGLDAVEESFGVTTGESPDNPQNAALRRASEALGQIVKTIPRNVSGCLEDGCRGCGFCTLGCRKGKKQGTLATWIARAARAGARLVPDTEALRVRVEGGRAVGVEALHHPPDGRAVPLFVRAGRVVVAAGSIHTPALLLRSGLDHPELGRHLHIHPTVVVGGFYRQTMESWYGTMMSAVNDQFSRLDGGWGCKLETAPVHPGLMGLALPWVSGRQHKENMLRARHLAAFIILLRDRHGGRVTVDRDGRPRLAYRLHPYDLGHLWRGIAEAARLHREAGAERLFLPHAAFPEHLCRDGGEALDRLLRDSLAGSRRPGVLQLFTAHQMGTCRMGGDRRRTPLSPEGRLWEVPNLWVADASAFPAASGVNPMITIQGLAWHTVQGMLAEG